MHLRRRARQHNVTSRLPSDYEGQVGRSLIGLPRDSRFSFILLEIITIVTIHTAGRVYNISQLSRVSFVSRHIYIHDIIIILYYAQSSTITIKHSDEIKILLY